MASSLEDVNPDNPDLQKNWLDEAERRYDEWKAGRATMHSAEDVLDELFVKYVVGGGSRT
jgi:hypothetical protein